MRLMIHSVVSAFVLISSFAAQCEAMDRASVRDQYKWDLTEIYASDAAWALARAAVAGRMSELGKYKGKLNESAGTLLGALDTMSSIDKEVARVNAYASMRSDEDTRESGPLANKQLADQLLTEYRSAAAFMRPEILALDDALLARFQTEEPKLALYRHYIDNITRLRAHTRSAAEELLIAQAGNIAAAPESLHTIFTNADLPYPDVKLSSGETVRLDASAYTMHRAAQKREDRLRVFEAFWGKYNEFRRTLGATLYSAVQTHIFNRDARRYASCLDASLDRNRIPTSVYRQLIADARRSLPIFHRYLDLRRRMLGLEKLSYEDVYAPLVGDVNLEFTPEQAMKITLDASEPLGAPYVDALRRAYAGRWVDFMPNDGKKSGAYSNGIVYDVHPYQLLNFNGRYEDLSTLAHESGHSMHAWLSNKAQPYIYSDSPIFLAEVASTLNENLLLHHMLAQTGDTRARMALLGEYLDNMRLVIFRQVMFAEFELAIHEMAERGEPLTGDTLNRIYLDLLRAYFGQAQGICEIKELYAVEWAYIPHFYYDFYVYQYATSMVAATAIAKGIREEEAGGTGARDAYLSLLRAGSSGYPIDLLKSAGVDMTTSAPFAAAMKEMNSIMDEIESIRGAAGAPGTGRASPGRP